MEALSKSQYFTFPALGQLSPHLFDALQHHVAVPVEGLDAAQQLFVVPEISNIYSKYFPRCWPGLWLYLQLMRTWVLFLTESVRTLSGPVWNSSCSFCSLCSGVISCLLILILSYSELFWCEIFLINTNVWLSFTLSNGARPGEFQWSRVVLHHRGLQRKTTRSWNRTYSFDKILHFTPLVKVLYAIYFTLYWQLTSKTEWWKFNENEIIDDVNYKAN